MNPVVQPLIHIGFYKTASTWLQKVLFLPEYGFEHVLEVFPLSTLLVQPAEGEFDSRRAAAALSDRMEAIADRGRVPVLSSEAFGGDLLRNGHDRWRNADRLHQAVGGGRILLVVREQGRLLRSMYKTLVLWGMPFSVDGLLRTGAAAARPPFDIEFIRFDSLADYYGSLFGSDAVMVLPYELFQQRPEDFLGHIYAHAGRDMPGASALRGLSLQQVLNPGQSLAYLHLQRWINRLTLTRYRDYAGLFDNNGIERIFRRIAWHRKNARQTRLDPWLERRFARQADRHLQNRFVDSNRALQVYCPVELAQFAYQM